MTAMIGRGSAAKRAGRKPQNAPDTAITGNPGTGINGPYFFTMQKRIIRQYFLKRKTAPHRARAPRTGTTPGAERAVGIVGGTVDGCTWVRVVTVVTPPAGRRDTSAVAIWSLPTVMAVDTGMYPSAAIVMICTSPAVTSLKTTVPVPGPGLPPTLT